MNTRQHRDNIAHREGREQNTEYSSGFQLQSNFHHPRNAPNFTQGSNYQDEEFQRNRNNRFSSLHFEDEDGFWTRV